MASRADNHEGSCTEVRTGKHVGKWRVQFVHRDEFGRKARLSRLFPTKTEGKRFLHGLRRGEAVETAQRKKPLTLGQWFDWLAEHDWPESLDPKTIALRKGRFDRYVRGVLGDSDLRKIDPLLVRRFYRGLLDDGVGQATVHAIKANLVRTFNQAQTPYGRVPASMANPFRLVLKALPPREAVAITPTAAASALACPSLEPYERAMLGVYLLGGLRLSEQMALTAQQLLFDQGLVHVDRAVRLDAKGRQHVGLPKGDKKRVAVMCPTLRDLLMPIVRELGPEDHLWSCKSENKPKMKKRTYDAWKEIVRKTGLPQDMSPHDCRLTHINWVEKLLPDVSPTTLKEHVGHASGRTVTEINYTRPITPAQDILRRGIERLVGVRGTSRGANQPPRPADVEGKRPRARASHLSA